MSASYKLQSGYETGRRVSVRLPNAGTERVMPDGYNDRAPNVGIFDMRAEKSFNIMGGATMALLFDGFNLVEQLDRAELPDDWGFPLQRDRRDPRPAGLPAGPPDRILIGS